MIHHIGHPTSIADESGIKIGLRVRKVPYLTCLRTILAEDAVELVLFSWLELQLCPASCRIQTTHSSAGVGKRTVPDRTSCEPRAEAANSTPAIKLPAQFQPVCKGHRPVRHASPRIHVTAQSPILAAVKTSRSQRQDPPERLATPRHAGPI